MCHRSPVPVAVACVHPLQVVSLLRVRPVKSPDVGAQHDRGVGQTRGTVHVRVCSAKFDILVILLILPLVLIRAGSSSLPRESGLQASWSNLSNSNRHRV